MLDQYRIDTQRALDELFGDRLIPFRLVARKITEESPGEFTIHFYDSRLRSVVVGVFEGPAFGSQVRSAVLQRLGGKGRSTTMGA